MTSIHEAILRLESQWGQNATVAALREVLRKQEKQASSKAVQR
jgi:hypothetical protein